MKTSTYFRDQLRALERLTCELNPALPDVQAAKRLIARFDRNPSLGTVPLVKRHALFEIRSLIDRLKTLSRPLAEAPMNGETMFDRIDKLEADLANLEQQGRDLEDRRTALSVTTAETRRELTKAREEALQREAEPERRGELADLIDRLKKRIASTPSRSITAQRASDLLSNIEEPDSVLTVSEAVSAVKEALRTYQRGVLYDDPSNRIPETARILGR